MRLKDEEGFGLIEILVALTVFMIIMLAVAAAFGGSLNAMLASRHKTLAEQLGTQCLEQIRAMDYEDIGVGATGNPPGTLAASSTTVAHGVTYTITRTVSWVNDPIPTHFVSGANYKSVRCRVSEPSRSNPQVSFKTNIAPPTKPDDEKSHITVTVQDFVNPSQLIEGAIVQLTGGPSAPRSAETPENGKVPFGDLTPNPTSGPQKYYDIHVTPPLGYLVHPSYVPPTDPSVPEDGQPARVNLAPGSPAETFNTTILVYKPATINVELRTCDGSLWTQPSTVTISSDSETQTFSTSTGQLTVTALNGKPIMPGISYAVSATSTYEVVTYSDSKSQTVPDDYPTNMTGGFALTMKTALGCPT